MHDGHDENEVRLNRVENAVREDAGETAPNVFFDELLASRRFENAADAALYHFDES